MTNATPFEFITSALALKLLAIDASMSISRALESGKVIRGTDISASDLIKENPQRTQLYVLLNSMTPNQVNELCTMVLTGRAGVPDSVSMDFESLKSYTASKFGNGYLVKYFNTISI